MISVVSTVPIVYSQRFPTINILQEDFSITCNYHFNRAYVLSDQAILNYERRWIVIRRKDREGRCFSWHLVKVNQTSAEKEQCSNMCHMLNMSIFVLKLYTGKGMFKILPSGRKLIVSLGIKMEWMHFYS